MLKGLEAPREEKKGLTITVSGLSGSGKNTLAEALGKKFGLNVINVGDIFRELAAESGLPLEKFMARVPAVSDRAADQRTLEYSARGGYLIVGRLAGLAAGEFSDFKIFLTAALDARAQRVSKRDGLTVGEAKRKVSERDSIDKERYKRVYGVDVNKLSGYDLIIDTTDKTVEETQREAIAAIREKLFNRS